MNVLILDTLCSSLKGTSKIPLYGFKTDDGWIAASVSPSPSLDQVGHFWPSPLSEMARGLVLFKDSDGKFAGMSGNDRVQVEVVRYSTDFQSRNQGIIDDSMLQTKSVAVFGLGSGGSAIVLDLVRAGVTKFILIDKDIVEASNLCRSAYDLSDVGLLKTAALAKKALRINPCVQLTIFNDDILAMPIGTMQGVVDSSDLIIEATDSIKTKILVNGLAYASRPVIYPAVYDKGRGGDILFTAPGLPCFECIFHSIQKQMRDDEKRPWNYSTDESKPMAALIADIQIIVARAVKLAIAILLSETDSAMFSNITEPDCTLLFVGNERGSFPFETPFQEVWANTEIDEKCTCRTLVGDMLGVQRA